ncbi:MULTISPECIES: FISUMP domain-containing protein [Chryseobacterium]|jgi:uncharacterized protein (TIGR02145 family)|uniref:FISUMP domain-containing protein n=1 Tax=Chryseobacterium TaxID=59732 RepID=UPI001AE15BA4|nr:MULTISPECIES: FISUMP domain-containing protein [Chryseobacterium]MBP1164667.1 uncharacterized protein (TIGR02145 family) [Chryseobacterium sp. PvR013]MDR6461526.1 uncharacterized protein (TIGR02145 family) [Chryseobacterium sediminis]
MKKKYLLPILFSCTLSYGQVGINSLTPKTTLDVTSKTTDGSASEGFMVPRVTGNSLKAADAVGVYAEAQNSALVFVTEAPDPSNRTGQVEGMDGPGFYYFDAGSNRWVKMISSGTSTAAVTQLLCSGSSDIGVVIANAPAAGVSTSIPYTGGNGGIYSSQTVNSIGVTGLTAVLASGTLNNGNGTLIFNITGTPSAAGTAIFDIDFGGQTCGFSRTIQPAGSFPDVVPVIVNGETRQIMTHNLGADMSLDPNTPVQAIMGNYYQWGRKNVVATAYTGSGAISGWTVTSGGNMAWNSGTENSPVKTGNDPCPAGFRVLSRYEWQGFNSASTTTNLGSWSGANNNYSTAKVFHNNGSIITFPAAGYRGYSGGALYYRSSSGYYWSSTEYTGGAYSLFFNNTSVNPGHNFIGSRASGFSVRCISE